MEAVGDGIISNIAFIGDSLTEYFDWRSRFPGHHVTNLGISGETVEGLLARMERICSAAGTPDFIFLMTGTNNIAMEDNDIRSSYKRALDALTSCFREAVIVVESIPPMNLPWVDNRTIEEINSRLKAIAKECKAEYLDVYSLFKGSEGCLLDDGVHISDHGYAQWSKLVGEFLDSTDS